MSQINSCGAKCDVKFMWWYNCPIVWTFCINAPQHIQNLLREKFWVSNSSFAHVFSSPIHTERLLSQLGFSKTVEFKSWVLKCNVEIMWWYNRPNVGILHMSNESLQSIIPSTLEISSERNLRCQIPALLMSNSHGATFVSARNFPNGKINSWVVKCNVKIMLQSIVPSTLEISLGTFWGVKFQLCSCPWQPDSEVSE